MLGRCRVVFDICRTTRSRSFSQPIMFYTEQNTYNILSLGILLRLARCNLLTHAYTLKPAADGLTYSMHGCQAADTSRHVTSVTATSLHQSRRVICRQVTCNTLSVQRVSACFLFYFTSSASVQLSSSSCRLGGHSVGR